MRPFVVVEKLPKMPVIPWKSGASAPRKHIKIDEGLQPSFSSGGYVMGRDHLLACQTLKVMAGLAPTSPQILLTISMKQK
jgi:hypothetical protein